MSEFISIHAPQWGATETRPHGDGWLLISIHAPQWGATRFKRSANDLILFQSTHPSGVRLGIPFDADPEDLISIHAPQWGATIWRSPNSERVEISIHAPQWGATVG